MPVSRTRKKNQRVATATHRPALRTRQFRHDDLVAVDLFCVDEQTEILTEAGWKRYNELAQGDTALTLLPDGSAAEWQQVQAVNVFPAQRRKLHRIEGRGISALTTENHRWLSNYRASVKGGRELSWRFVRSDQLTIEDRIPMAAPVANLPTTAAVPDAFVELVAWYWTEGTDRACGRVHIVQDHTINPQHVAAIRAALVDLFGPERSKRKRPGGPQWAENRWGNQTTFGLNREAAHALRKAAPDKVLSVAWLTTLTQQQLNLLIQRSLDADGHERQRAGDRVERVLVQGDHARASAFQAACLIAGHAASMKRYRSTYRHKETVREVASWAVTVGMRQFVKPLRQKQVEWVEHDGIVWCPTTPNGTWLARRNGTCYFTGNSGFGGLTKGIEMAGFTTILAANHNEYKTKVHETNNPGAEHWIADLVDKDSADYHDVRDLPKADLLVAGVSCTNHSVANTQRAYATGLTLFDLGYDEEYEERVTRSERDRATFSCTLHYAQRHHPRMILIECTPELQSWGAALPNRPKVGDGTTFRWVMRQFGLLNYKHKIMYLNSMFFGVGQSRDRIYIALWDKSIPDPDLEHTPGAHCGTCDRQVEARWTWKTGVPANGTVRYGQQYNYRCPSCKTEVVPPMTPSISALDLTDLGKRIGDKPIKTYPDGFVGPMARSTMGRAERAVRRFPEFPPILMQPGQLPGTHPWQTGQGLIQSTGALMVAAGNTYERAGSDCRIRDTQQPFWTQPATNTTGLVTPPIAVAGNVIAAHRHNGDGRHLSEPMNTVTSTYEKGLVIAVNNYQGVPRGIGEPFPTQAGSETLSLLSSGVMPLRNASSPRGLADPMPAVTAAETLSLLSTGVMPFRKHTRPALAGEAMPTMTSDQVPGLVTTQQKILAGDSMLRDWMEALRTLDINDCFFRMLFKHEVGRACGFDPDFPGHEGTFVVWGTAQQQIDGYGNAVSPQVGYWIAMRLRAALHACPV